MRHWVLAGTLLLALALSACDSRAMMKRFTPDAQDKAAQALLDDIGRGNFAPVRAALDPAVKLQMTTRALQQMQAMLAQMAPESRKLIGSQTVKSPGITRYGLSYEYGTGAHWLLAEVVLQEEGGRQILAGIHLAPMAQSLEQFHAFSLSKPLPFLVALMVAILIPVFVLWTAYMCWRTPNLKRKWLWLIFVLIATGACNLNWTTGELRFALLQVQLLGAGFIKPDYGPMTLQVGFPLGALLFWVRRKAWRRRAEEAAAA